MVTKKIIALGVALLALAAAAAAADLSISLQVNTAAKDNAGNFLTYNGKAVSVVKDQFAEAPDGVSGASKLEGTAMFNVYRWDVFGGKLLPGGLRNFFLYPIGGDATRVGDGLTVTKAASGSIQVRFVHRGTAVEFATDLNGALTLPSALVKTRKIGHTDNTISTDFSASGKVADIDWQKVWDWSIPDGKQIGGTASKTGKIVFDTSNSAVYVWTGALKFSLDGPILKVAGDLMAQAPTP
jgi:hypothetical protein